MKIEGKSKREEWVRSVLDLCLHRCLSSSPLLLDLFPTANDMQRKWRSKNMREKREGQSLLKGNYNVELLLKPLNLHPVQSKTIIDKFAAVGILQGYLDYVSRKMKLEAAE
uniref:Uncharacterized protein n=1 Tax=Quercus lobata TaxID=97700 RepID=A0A7N2N4P4_QUELO